MADISKMTLPDNSQYNLTDTNLPHSSLSGESGGTTLSLVTTGEKYNWNNRDKKVTQTAITTNANYELLFSGTADNTSRTETVNKCSKILLNPSTGDFKCQGSLTFENVKVLKAQQLWQGNVSGGGSAVAQFTVGNKWNYLIVFTNRGSDTNRKAMIIPIAMLPSEFAIWINFEFHTQSDFISFQLSIDPIIGEDKQVSLRLINETSGSAQMIRDVWGAN